MKSFFKNLKTALGSLSCLSCALFVAVGLMAAPTTANAAQAYAFQFATIAAMQAAGPAWNTTISSGVVGGTQGAGETFNLVTGVTTDANCNTFTAPIDGGTTFCLHDSTGTGWRHDVYVKRQLPDNWCNVVNWGVINDNAATDQATAMNAAANGCRALFTGPSRGVLYIPSGFYIKTGVVDRAGLSVMARGATIKGMPSQDILYYPASNDANAVAPPMGLFTIVSNMIIDDTVDATGSFSRWDAGGDRVGNCAIVFAGGNAIPYAGLPPYASIDVNVQYLTGADNRQCAVFMQDGKIAYGFHVIHLQTVSISYTWVDGITDAYAATANHLTGYITATGNDFTGTTLIGIACDGNNIDASGTLNPVGNYTTCPAGLTARQPGYYPINIGGAGAGTFQLSLTVGGAAVSFTGDGANFAVAPILASSKNGGATANEVFDDLHINSNYRVGLSFQTQSQQIINIADNHSRTWGRWYNWGDSGQPGGNNNIRLSQAYSEGPTNGVTGDEYLHVEGTNFTMKGLGISPTNGALNLYDTLNTTRNSNFEFEVIGQLNDRINLVGNSINLEVNSFPSPGAGAAALIVNNLGVDNKVSLIHNSNASQSTVDERHLVGQSFAIQPGGISQDWLFRTPSSGSYGSNRSLMIPGYDTYPLSAAAASWSYPTTDHTGYVSGNITLNSSLGAVNLTQQYAATQNIVVGVDVPATKGWAYISMKAGAAITDTFNLAAFGGGITSTAVTCTVTTSYPAVPCAVRYDATAAAGKTVLFSLGAPSIATDREVNYVAIVPDFDYVSASTVSYTKLYTFGTLPACATGNTGDTTLISDGAAAPVYYANAAGGGTVKQKVFCNGTNWVNN